MNRKLGSMTLAAIVCVACNRNAAQTTTNAAGEVVPIATVTVVGCVKPSAASPATGPVGTTGSTTDTKYSLTNAKSTPQTASTYQLDATDSTLSPEVNHQVEIVAVAPDPPKSPTDKPKLKVETIRMIATTCPE